MGKLLLYTFCWIFVLCQIVAYTNCAEPIDIKIEEGGKRQKGPKFIMMIPDKKPILSGLHKY
uniref:Seminal fluid protein HACP046 n=1 Tax=Heliconius erato TaxID=33431 RepID=D9HQ53_HELEA|nr:seminal fluid protein HACP046 [Heliconius erato]